MSLAPLGLENLSPGNSDPEGVENEPDRNRWEEFVSRLGHSGDKRLGVEEVVVGRRQELPSWDEEAEERLHSEERRRDEAV